VTAAYLWCGAADVYAETGEQALLDALLRLWEDVTERKMYITGGTAALHTGEADRRLLRRWPRDSVHEAFGAPYQLPNRTAYNETCANIANAMWNWRMLALTGEAKYAEVMERVLYNSMLSGIGIEGRDFFYTNPLRRIDGQPMLSNDSAARWSDTTPASPVRCFCCPPNVARTLAELNGWAYGVSQDVVWVHLYGSNVLDSRLPGGGEIRLVQQTQYPWDGQVTMAIEKAPERELALRLRIPGWAQGATIQVNGQAAGVEIEPLSYVELRRRWIAGDTIRIDLPMEVVMVEAHPLVEETRNHAAVMRGPVVYCLESVDLPAGVALDDVRLPRGPAWQVRHDAGLLRGVTVLETEALGTAESSRSPALYRPLPTGAENRIPMRLIPYFAWSNRGPSEMAVWIPLANDGSPTLSRNRRPRWHPVPNRRRCGGGQRLHRVRVAEPPVGRAGFVARPTPVRAHGRGEYPFLPEALQGLGLERPELSSPLDPLLDDGKLQVARSCRQPPDAVHRAGRRQTAVGGPGHSKQGHAARIDARTASGRL
jgi:uncharacterized protein